METKVSTIYGVEAGHMDYAPYTLAVFTTREDAEFYITLLHAQVATRKRARLATPFNEDWVVTEYQLWTGIPGTLWDEQFGSPQPALSIELPMEDEV